MTEALASAELNHESAITLITGLPRSGTSMMMQMLAAGGFPLLTDGIRLPDANNAQGYLEYEPVKRIHAETSWLPLAYGKALKVVAPLLPLLPLKTATGAPLQYRAVFMQRDVMEIADSQRRMLCNLGLGHLVQPDLLLQRALCQDIDTARAWLDRHEVPYLDIDYQETLANPAKIAARLAAFIVDIDPAAAATACVSPSDHPANFIRLA